MYETPTRTRAAVAPSGRTMSVLARLFVLSLTVTGVVFALIATGGRHQESPLLDQVLFYGTVVTVVSGAFLARRSYRSRTNV